MDGAMATRQTFDDEILPASMMLSVRRGSAGTQPDPAVGIDMVVLPVTIEIEMTPELWAQLARK